MDDSVNIEQFLKISNYEKTVQQLDVYYGIVKRQLLRYQCPITGLFPVLSIDTEVGSIRDSVYCATAVWGLYQAYRSSEITIGDEEEPKNLYFDYDYMKTIWGISPFVENVVNFIGGFIIGKLIEKRIVTSDICIKHPTLNNNTSMLMNLKNRGPFLYSCKGVVHICEVSENMIRCYKDSLFNNPQIINFLTTQIMQWVNHRVTFESSGMDSHIKSQDIFENHKIILVKLIIKIYLKVRMHHESKVVSEKNNYIKQKYSRLILFSGK